MNNVWDVCNYSIWLPQVAQTPNYLWPVQIISIALLLWLLYDIIYLHWFPRWFVNKQMAIIDKEIAAEVETIVDNSITHFSLDKLPTGIQKLLYFQGIKKRIPEIVHSDDQTVMDFMQKLREKYCKALALLFFDDAVPALCAEDLALIDYKLQHKQREIAVLLYNFKISLQETIGDDLIALIKILVASQQQEVDMVRRSILKDQDTLAILGMDMPLEKAAQVIINSGIDFDVNKIHPKSLSTIASSVNREQGLFCNLIWKASKKNIDKFATIFRYDRDKGENVPSEFLNYAANWVERRDIKASQLTTIRRRLQNLQVPQQTTIAIERQDREARTIMKQLLETHLDSYEHALQYLGLDPLHNPSSQEIEQRIGLKRKELNESLTFVKKEKRKKFLVELHMLKHELPKFLHKG